MNGEPVSNALQLGELSTAMRLIVAVQQHYRESETQARRRIYHNGETWKAEALRRLEAGTPVERLFEPDSKWRLKP